MILYALFNVLIFVLGLLMNVLTGIPGISSINETIAPYIQALEHLLTNGMNLISFFIPVGLLKVIIPLVITIEIIVDNLDIIKFAMKKVLGR